MSTTEEASEAGRTRPGKLVIGLAVALVVVIGGLAFVVLTGGSGSKASAEPPPVPGEVMTLEPMQLNLEGGHYLRIGLALQLVEGAHEIDGSQALDAAIDQFSGLSIEELSQPVERKHLKAELEKHLAHLYHDEVMAVYFTQFVMQ